MISFDEALARVLAGAARLGSERVGLADAHGRVLAEDLVAGADMPAFSYSAMDGYALASAELPADGRLPLRGESRAGGPPLARLEPGSACRIFTGAPLPDGADAVVMQEEVERGDEAIVLSRRVRASENVRPRGADLRAGAVALRAGERLTAARVGLAAGIDRAAVAVARRPIVAFLGTGDELRPPGEPGPAGSIPESNGYVLAALAHQAGGVARVLPFARDEAAHTEAAIRDALAASDVLVTIGGASVGDHDLVRPALEAASVTIAFWGVAIKPGKPTAAGTAANGARVLCLPGNPASATLTFLLFGMPLLRALQGDTRPVPPRIPTRVLGSYPRKPGREEYLRARFVIDADGLAARLEHNQASGAVTSFAGADALVVAAADQAAVSDGQRLPVIRLDDC